MREIKFRAWDKKTNKLRAVNSIAFHYEKGSFDYNNSRLPKVVNVWGKDIIEEKDIILHREIEDVNLMQFTGLHDKNGKEIYEGDIVVMTIRENIGTFNVPDDILANDGYTGRDDVYTGEIIYKNGLSAFGIDDKENDFIQLYKGEEDNDTILEVIGNIYQNSELLKVEK